MIDMQAMVSELPTLEQWIKQQVNNDILVGIVGAALLGSLIFAARNVPLLIWRWLNRYFTVELLVNSDSHVYDNIDAWLSQGRFTRFSRHFKLSTQKRASSHEGPAWILTPGYGFHVFFFGGRLVIVERVQLESREDWNFKEQLKITVIGRDRTRLDRLVESARAYRTNGDMLEIRSWADYWRFHSFKAKRRMDTVFLPEGVLKGLVTDVHRFREARDWYLGRGIPYRRGYLLFGPPGCGKTSAVMALASETSSPLYCLNLSMVANDEELSEAFDSVPMHGILLIEDVDAVGAMRPRTEAGRSVGIPSRRINPVLITHMDDGQTKITLSGLLNVLDGALSPDGRVIIMTTNHPERLDPALLRPGRVDYRLEIGPMKAPEFKAMFTRFYGVDLNGQGDGYTPLPAAQVLGSFMLHPRCPEKAIMELVSNRNDPSAEVQPEIGVNDNVF